MDRRNFLKLSGLSASALFFSPAVKAASWQDTHSAIELVKAAQTIALAQGALYTDARVGECEIQGHTQTFTSVSLFHAEMLGMRVCMSEGWKHIVLRNMDPHNLEKQLTQALQSASKIHREEGYWVSAEFCKGKILAQQSSDPYTEKQLNAAWIRYAERPPLPKSEKDLLFCDLLLEQ